MGKSQFLKPGQVSSKGGEENRFENRNPEGGRVFNKVTEKGKGKKLKVEKKGEGQGPEN